MSVFEWRGKASIFTDDLKFTYAARMMAIDEKQLGIVPSNDSINTETKSSSDKTSALKKGTI